MPERTQDAIGECGGRKARALIKSMLSIQIMHFNQFWFGHRICGVNRAAGRRTAFLFDQSRARPWR
jgi:hypothetical protein